MSLLLLALLSFLNLAGIVWGTQQEAELPLSESMPGFHRFWKEFRMAAMDSTDKLPALIQFPLQLHGILDDDPKQQCNAKELQKVWTKILEGEVFITGKKGKLIQITERDFLQQHTELNPEMIMDAGENRLRVDDFVFIKLGKKWLLEQVYTDTYAVSCSSAK